MRTKNGEKFKLESVEELLGIQNEESAMDIEINKICPFRKHPFKVVDDEKMQELVESITTNGVLTPVLVRPLGMDADLFTHRVCLALYEREYKQSEEHQEIFTGSSV